jgi:hypothetical protein
LYFPERLPALCLAGLPAILLGGLPAIIVAGLILAKLLFTFLPPFMFRVYVLQKTMAAGITAN